MKETHMGKTDPRVDAYIARSAPFAKPILTHFRRVVHAGCPQVEETLKWSSPHFMYKGMLCGMAAFKKHCAFGFWKEALLRGRVKGMAAPDEPGMGQFGCITAVSDLPAERTLLRLVKAAVELNDRGIRSPARSKPKGDRKLDVPVDLTITLRKNRKALRTFEAFSYTNRKDYVEWIAEAKRAETRRRRLKTAVAWMAEGKARNWKYMKT
jgi:uncharacterized protein YdeI (YjbR/CyaY-like superfamily)